MSTSVLTEPSHSLTIRAAHGCDSPTLASLGLRNGRSRSVDGWALLAERGGAPVAAIALTSGTVLASPSQENREAVRLLRLTRYRILRQGGQTGAARSLVRRHPRPAGASLVRRHPSPAGAF